MPGLSMLTTDGTYTQSRSKDSNNTPKEHSNPSSISVRQRREEDSQHITNPVTRTQYSKEGTGRIAANRLSLNPILFIVKV